MATMKRRAFLGGLAAAAAALVLELQVPVLAKAVAKPEAPALTLEAMQRMYMECIMGDERPTVIVMPPELVEEYAAMLTPIQASFYPKGYPPDGPGLGGFRAYLFCGTPVVPDPVSPPGTIHMLGGHEDRVFEWWAR